MSPRTRARALERARASGPVPPASLFADPPAGYGRFSVSTEVAGVPLADAGAALLGWSLHRAAGLRVVAAGPARAGETVVVGVPLGPLAWAAPCRVLAVVDGPDEVGFTYATLPGHPEHGIESFRFLATPGGLLFVVEAVSRPSLAVARVVPAFADAAQRFVTHRYLAAARAL
ncbi:DUF1990 family protein [Cellulomonas sp. PhB150]|uniref:DUF1990 family protein n=1 Tax=Cellulomonas sp. PhB150 TaxID=2485188 RepID=UPI000FB8EF58|nr:DUF1990 domain-containing protein [Cellulomonas sp. PhB150]ROS30785.1 uncharacterized protein (UPF0548 family) [Cellulomonas sp. PhB150]